MERFLQGWWVCYLALIEEIQSDSSGLSAVLEGVAESSGVTQSEINRVFETFPNLSEEETAFLTRLQAKLRRFR